MTKQVKFSAISNVLTIIAAICVLGVIQSILRYIVFNCQRLSVITLCNTLAMNLSTRLRLALERKSLKSVDLAKATGIGTGTIGDWLSGKSKTMVVENAFKVCEFLEVTQEWLFFGKGSIDIKNDTPKRRIANQLLAETPEYAIDDAVSRLSDLKKLIETAKKSIATGQ